MSVHRATEDKYSKQVDEKNSIDIQNDRILYFSKFSNGFLYCINEGHNITIVSIILQ